MDEISAQQFAAFKEAYDAYKEGISSGRRMGMYTLARNSFELGCQFFGEESFDCAVLAVNFANIADNRDKTPIKLIEGALPAYKEKYGENSLQVGQLYTLGAQKAPWTAGKTAKDYQRKANDVIDSLEESQPIYAELLRVKLAESYLYRGDRKSRRMISAVEKLEELLPSNDFGLIEPNFTLGRYYLSTGKPEKSTAPFLRVLEIVEASGKPHKFAAAARAFLVQAYAKSGQDEKATAMSVEIGRTTPWANSAAPVPLYRVEPVYPISLAKQGKEGHAQFSFDIDEQGFMTNIKNIGHDGDRRFINAAHNALKQWRYSPRFEDGKPVLAKGFKIQMDFNLPN